MLKRISFVLAGALILAEVTVRLIGFGSPPLSVTHPNIEYMFAPNQDVMRFHRRVFYDAWGMRSDPVEQIKNDKSEFMRPSPLTSDFAVG